MFVVFYNNSCYLFFLLNIPTFLALLLYGGFPVGNGIDIYSVYNVWYFEMFKNKCFRTTYLHISEELRFLNTSLLHYFTNKEDDSGWRTSSPQLGRFSWLDQMPCWQVGQWVSCIRAEPLFCLLMIYSTCLSWLAINACWMI